jgi:protein-L-isoaspartate(D-aspartate) O-methyltransferase
MMEDLAVQHLHKKSEAQPHTIELPRVLPRFQPREQRDLEALFGVPDLPIARRYLREQLYHRGIREDVLNALDLAPRHVFVPARSAQLAYVNIALHVDHTFVPSPHTVATVASTLSSADAHVLEIGTGTGYQSAVLAALGARVVTVDSKESTQDEARERFGKLSLNVKTLVRSVDPIEEIEGPFDLIVVSEALVHMPRRLICLLREHGGCIVAPIQLADGQQRLMRYQRSTGLRISAVDLGPCFALVSQRKRPA